MVKLNLLFEFYLEQVSTMVELVESPIALKQAPTQIDIALIKKWRVPQTAEVLKAFVEMLSHVDVLKPDVLLQMTKEMCGAHQVKKRIENLIVHLN